jgi:hypothetical protein
VYALDVAGETERAGGRRRWVVAAVVCAAFWVLALVRARTVVPPERELTFTGVDGQPVAHVVCHHPAFADGDAVWRMCSVIEGGYFLVRAEPARGVARLVAPLSGGDMLLGVARSDGGDLAVLTLKSLVVVHEGALARRLELPPELSPFVGLAWVGGDVEIVPFGDSILRAQGDGWVKRRLTWPPVPERTIAMAIRAWRDGDAWRIAWHVHPVEELEKPTQAEIVVADESGMVLDRQTVPVEGYVTVGLLDGAPGNCVTLITPRPWLELHDGRWQPLALPPGVDRSATVSQSYVLRTNALEAVVLTDGQARVGGRWQPTGDASALDDVVPAAGGGVWRFEVPGYVRLDETGRRIDPPGFFERLGRVFRRATWPQRLALSWAFFLLPVLAAAASAWRRLRESPRVATWYTIASVVVGWWVWTLLGDL